MTAWGYPGDAIQLALPYCAGELTVVRIPTAAEARGRDVVRCRETSQRTVLKSRHYNLRFLTQLHCQASPTNGTHVHESDRSSAPRRNAMSGDARCCTSHLTSGGSWRTATIIGVDCSSLYDVPVLLHTTQSSSDLVLDVAQRVEPIDHPQGECAEQQ